MSEKIVSYTMDTLPPLTLDDLRRLKEQKDLPDEQIDFSDIPELTDAQFDLLKRSVLFRPVKKQITVRLDADVLDWLKIGGKGYQTRMNKILRHAMQTYTWEQIMELHSLEDEYPK